ncbi:MAG: Zn-dependent alcohol dehydrogenase [Dehalococcoidia bacterium]
MKAAVFHGPNQDLIIEDIDLDKPMAREVLVKTAASGVCHSDLHFVDGLYPYPAPAVLGHEAAGIVEEVGELVTQFQPGDHVIACLSTFCGNCEYCLSGHPSLCRSPETSRAPGQPPKMKRAGKDEPVHQFLNISSFAEHMLLHENAIVKIREDMPLDRAALIGCGVMTGVGAALNTARVEPGTSTVVFGAGGVGLAAIQGCRIAGAGQVIAVDVVESKLGLAKELGATHTVDASQGDPVAKIRDITGGGAHYTFEAIGNKDVAEQAFDALRAGGTATVIGMIPIGQKVELTGSSFLQEKKIQGCTMGSNRFRIDMPRYVDFYLRGILKLDEMITKRGQLGDVNEAFRAMKAGEVARTVLMFNGA